MAADIDRLSTPASLVLEAGRTAWRGGFAHA
jgi:hypothetical protein